MGFCGMLKFGIKLLAGCADYIVLIYMLNISVFFNYIITIMTNVLTDPIYFSLLGLREGGGVEYAQKSV